CADAADSCRPRRVLIEPRRSDAAGHGPPPYPSRRGVRGVPKSARKCRGGMSRTRARLRPRS
ncbi:MAG: hypothetical protein AVDCRST_MAG19-3361, partial [uncultured Thermomicrobiales bacterium]